MQLPGAHAPGHFASVRPYQPPTAAQAAEAALHAELPAVPGLAPSSALQADVDAFLRGVGPPQAAVPPEFHEFESIYAAGPAPPGMMPASSTALAPFLRVRGCLVQSALLFLTACLAGAVILKAADSQ